MKQSMMLLTSSKDNDWGTPGFIADMAHEVMSGIDLDPASSYTANKVIRASTIYTIDDDGLSKSWFGRVWLNPPYGKTGSRSNQDIWAEKLFEEYNSGNVFEGLLLTKSVPGYVWWENLFRTLPVCMVRERLCFIKNSKTGQAKAGTSIWYIGNRVQRFNVVFSRIGRIIYP